MPKKTLAELAAELKTARNKTLDIAAEKAMAGNANTGVQTVINMIERATDSAEVQNIMDGATKRGFNCEFYPVGGQIGVRVEWRTK